MHGWPFGHLGGNGSLRKIVQRGGEKMTFLIVCVSVFIGIIIGVAQVIRAKEIMENYSTVTKKQKGPKKRMNFVFMKE